MFARVVLLTVLVFSLFASVNRAHAADPKSVMWNDVPAAPDKGKSKNLVTNVERWLVEKRWSPGGGQMVGRNAEMMNKDPSTAHGIKAKGFNFMGLSMAGAGASTWFMTTVTGLRAKSGITIAPRLYAGGGGLGIAFRW